MMLTIQQIRGGVVATVIWAEGTLSGDQRTLDLVEGAILLGWEVDATATGPRMPVSLDEPRTIIRLLDDEGDVVVAGEMPDPTWDISEEPEDAVY